MIYYMLRSQLQIRLRKEETVINSATPCALIRPQKAMQIKCPRETMELFVRQALSLHRRSSLFINCKSPTRNIEVAHLAHESSLSTGVAC